MLMSPITTHVLDTALGRPAQGIAVILETADSKESWTELARGVTNADGRISSLLPDGATLAGGVYRLRFATAAYFTALGVRFFYPEVVVQFRVDEPTEHFHVPLLLSPFAYSTYRGS
jgi:5-hydroxyisourate hydrolase